MQKNVSCNIKLNETAIKQLERAQITALEKTAEFIHTDVVQSQTIPFDVPTEKEKAAGKTTAGTLQNEKHFIDSTQSKIGKVFVALRDPTPDGCIFTLNIILIRAKIPMPAENGLSLTRTEGKRI